MTMTRNLTVQKIEPSSTRLGQWPRLVWVEGTHMIPIGGILAKSSGRIGLFWYFVQPNSM